MLTPRCSHPPSPACAVSQRQSTRETFDVVLISQPLEHRAGWRGVERGPWRPASTIPASFIIIQSSVAYCFKNNHEAFSMCVWDFQWNRLPGNFQSIYLRVIMSNCWTKRSIELNVVLHWTTISNNLIMPFLLFSVPLCYLKNESVRLIVLYKYNVYSVLLLYL